MSNNLSMQYDLTITNRTQSYFDIEQIKESLKSSISILDVANRLGILEQYNITKSGQAYLGNCPTGHSSENQQCFSLNTEQNYYHCFNCHTAGDTISLVQMIRGISYKQALLWLAEQFQAELAPEIEQLSFTQTPEQKDLYTKHILYEELLKYGKEVLYGEPGKEALEALIKRGYAEDKLKQTEWIYWPCVAEIRQHLLKTHPEMKDIISKLPLVGAYGDDFRLAFPYRNRQGIITGFIKRSTERTGYITADGKNIRYDSTPGVDKHDLFGLYRIKTGEELLIVEGYPDAIYLPALGIVTVVALGQGAISTHHLEGLRMRKIPRVTLALDNDSVGLVNTERALRLLAETGIEAYVIDPSLYGTQKDPDEFVATNGVEAFKRLVDNPTSGARWMTQRLLVKNDVSSDIGRKNTLYEAFEYADMLNNPIDSKDVVEILSSGLSLTVEMLEPYLQDYQKKKADEQYKKNANSLISQAGALLYHDDLEKAMDLLTIRPRELALEHSRTYAAPQESFGAFLRIKKAQDMTRIDGALLGFDLRRFKQISQHLSGIQPGSYILGAYPNVGKTAFMTNLAIDLLDTNSKTRLILYSMDDDRGTIVNRMLALLTGRTINDVQRKQTGQKERAMLDKAYDYLADLYGKSRLSIQDISELNNIDDIEIDIRKIRSKANLIIMIDGLYNMNVNGETQSIREENIKRAMRMKELTKTYNIPLIATAELRKKMQDGDRNKMPTGHDIMETGKYQYIADVIWLLSPENYDKYDREDEPIIRLKFDKNKLSAYRGTMELKFVRAKSTFEEVQTLGSFTDQMMGGIRK